MYFEMIQHSTRSNYLHMRFNICMVIFDLATQPPFLPAPLMTEAGSSPGNRKPGWFSALEEDTELGKGPESRRSPGWGKAEVWETVPKSLQTDTGTGLRVTRGREVGACRVQVSLVGGPRQVGALWKEGTEVCRRCLRILHPAPLLRQCQAPYGLGWRVLAVQHLLGAP